MYTANQALLCVITFHSLGHRLYAILIVYPEAEDEYVKRKERKS